MTTQMDPTLIAFGANLPAPDGSGPLTTCQAALVALRRVQNLRFVSVSRWYRTEPIPRRPGQPDFCNGVARFEEYSPLKPLTDWLAYNGYTLVTKPAKEFTDASGRRRVKGNMDIELAIDMLELADHLDHVVLFSGDSDFRRLVEAVQRRGVRVTVVSSVKTSPPMIADELRRQADQFVERSAVPI